MGQKGLSNIGIGSSLWNNLPRSMKKPTVLNTFRQFSWKLELIRLLLVFTYIPYPFIYLFMYLFIYSFIYLFIHLFIYFCLSLIQFSVFNFYFTYLPFPLPFLTFYFILFFMYPFCYFNMFLICSSLWYISLFT